MLTDVSNGNVFVCDTELVVVVDGNDVLTREVSCCSVVGFGNERSDESFRIESRTDS